MKKYLIFTNSDNRKLCIDAATIFAIEEINNNGVHALIHCIDRPEPFAVKDNHSVIMANYKKSNLAEFVDV